LVLCFDGTGDTFDNDNSNVVQLTSFLKKDDPTKQMVYYQTGIGTGSEADARFEFVRDVTKSLDSMFALTLGTHVLDGYEFLMNHYQEGDSICIFGFSRGAYTARALAGMIQKVGLLPTGNRQQLPFAYQIFADEEKTKFAQEFKDTFSVNVKIQFVGVWDTVASVGLLPRHLPFVSSNNAMRCFRHALALDEHRAKFVPSFLHFSEQDEDDEETAYTDGSNSPVTPATPAIGNSDFLSPLRMTRTASAASDTTLVESFKPKKSAAEAATDAKEVWFAGVHTDVGGGSVENKTRHSLARISLRWMIRECWKAQTGIIFDMDKLKNVAGLDVDEKSGTICDAPEPLDAQARASYLEGRISPPEPNFLQKAWNAITSPINTFTNILSDIYQVSSGYTPLPDFSKEKLPSVYGADAEDRPFEGEAVEELFDALSPMYDQLHISPFWWVLEWLPLWTKKERALHAKEVVPFPGFFCSPLNLIGHIKKWRVFLKNYLRNHRFTINNGRGRKVYKHIMKRGMLVHRSVLTRMKAIDRYNNAGTYIPLIQPNIPDYTDETGGVRPMSFREWTDRKPYGGEHLWFHWWGNNEIVEKATRREMRHVRRDRKKAKAALKLKAPKH